MRRKEAYPLEKVTLNLRRGDFRRLQHMHGRTGAGKVIRQLVIGHITRVDDKVDKIVPSPTLVPDPLDLLETDNKQSGS